MALLVALSSFLVLLLVLAILGLYLDTRGDRRARQVWQRATDARVGGHDKAIATLERAVALLVPPDARPTAPHARAAGLSRPFQPTGEQQALARRAHRAAELERAELPEPPVDTRGDRGGINPGDPISTAVRPGGSSMLPESGTRDAMGEIARALAEVEGAFPEGSEAESVDEPTQVFTARADVDADRPRRPTLLGGLAVMPKPVRSKQASQPTLVSAGVLPPANIVGSSRAPEALRGDAVDVRFRALCDAARAAGLATDHCEGAACWEGEGEAAGTVCLCACDGCRRATGYAEQAEREVMGPSEPDGDPRKRRG